MVDFTSPSGNNQIQGSGGQATITGLAGNNPFTSLTGPGGVERFVRGIGA